jgi:hypothetical protein
MNTGLYRTQILLEKKQHDILAAQAQQENRSLSDKVREIINRYLTEQNAEAQLNRELTALGNLKRIREQTALAYDGIYAGDPIAEARAEREAETDAVQGRVGARQ